MVTTLMSFTTHGLDPVPVNIEVDIARGLPSFRVVGLVDACVRESRERVKSAIKNSGFDFSLSRITVNLAPSDLNKEGSYFDLPIALGILASTHQIPDDALSSYLFAGELALDGSLRPMTNTVGLALFARSCGRTHVVLPRANAERAQLIPGLVIYPADHLHDVVRHVSGKNPIAPLNSTDGFSDAVLDNDESHSHANDRRARRRDLSVAFEDISGQQSAKRALEIAAAGGHNVLFSGPPGTGKTMLARAVCSILPRMTAQEQLEVTQIHDQAGLLSPSLPLMTERPFRSPHHRSTPPVLLGKLTPSQFGEITLAHRGVLFLDEFPEFSRETLESLRQPLEDGVIHHSSRRGTLSYPSRFILIASMNPCPCGYAGDSLRHCTCSAFRKKKYLERLSGPLLDRIDLFVSLHRATFQEIREERTDVPTSAEIGRHVEAARLIQKRLFRRLRLVTNSEMRPKDLHQFCVLDSNAQKFLEQLMSTGTYSTRAYSRILKVARTIADLDGVPSLSVTHLAEAIQYRNHAP